GLVPARDDDEVLDAREETLDRPTDDRLALELQEKFLPSHPAREPGGEDDPRDHPRRGEPWGRSRRGRGASGGGWAEAGTLPETRSLWASIGRGAPDTLATGRVASVVEGSVPACARYAPARFTASVIARLAKTRQRCDLYSTEPWRSGCTSTPSAAFCAAASIAAASSFLPVQPASTPLARTALVPAPVTPIEALEQAPLPSSVTAAATPTAANRRIADQRRDLGEDGELRLHHRRRLDLPVGGHRADREHVAVLLDPREPGDLAQVDQVLGLRQPQLHHRDQAVAAGEQLGVVL